MTDRLPDPLTPADCDVRSYPDMMLDVALLRDSDFAAHPDAEVFRSGVLAWCVAFHQVPAASLPDDDAAIARLIGLGRDVGAAERFAALREQGALRGFIKCSDGRLYHPVIADKVFKALASKAKNIERTKAATAARLALAASRHEQRDERRDVQRDVQRDGAQNAHQPNQTKPNLTEQNRKKDRAPELPLGAAAGKKPVFQIPDWVPVPAWAAFAEMRASIKKPLTPSISERVVMKLSTLKTLGHDPAEVLDQSIRNSWRDVFAVKPESQGHGSQKPASNSFGAAASRVVRRRNPFGVAGSGNEAPAGHDHRGSAQNAHVQGLLPAPDDNAGGV